MATLILVAMVGGAVRTLLLLVRRGPGTVSELQDQREAPSPSPLPEPARLRRVARAAAVAALAAAAALGVTGLARSAYSEISTVAGSATAGFAGDGGPATSASLDRAAGVAVAADGVMFIADSVNDRIRRVGTDGTISTFAGSGFVAWSGDGGPATAAGMNTPRDVAIDLDGDLYVADTFNDVVRRIDTNGVITTVAGTGSSGWTGDGGPATTLKLSAPEGIAVEADGDLLIADTGNHRIRRVDAAGQMTTVAGNGAGSYGGDGGPATSAQVKAPVDIAPYGAGGFVIADTGNNRMRSVSANGTISTLAGTGTAGGGGDGGLAVDAQLRSPAGVVVSGSGSVFLADRDNHRIRRVSTSGYISTAAGTGTAGFSGDGGSAIFARLSAPQRLASGSGGLYVADSANSRIRSVEGVGVTVPAPTVSAVSPAGPANDNAPEVTGTAAAGTTVRIYTNASCTSAIAASGTAAAFASPGLTVSVADDSSTTFYATATDANGVKSWCSPSSVSYTEDSTPPGAATISDAPPARSSDTTPTWTFSGPATLRCRLDGPDGEVEPWVDCSSPKTSAALATDGAYTLSVLTRDAAGNESTAVTSTFTLDRVGPGAPTIETAPAAETKDDTPTFAFTGEADATFECRLWRDGATVPAWGACATPHTADISAQSDGPFTFRVRAVDAALNPGAEQEATFTLDRVAPAASSFTGGSASPSPGPDPAWTFTTPADATSECRLDRGEAEIAGWNACESPVTYALAGESDGTYTVSLRSVDAAGNHGTVDTTSYVLDRARPDPPSITSGPPPVGAGTSPTWHFTAEAGADVECRLVGTVEISGWTDCTDPHVVDLSGEDDGTYTLSIRATDAARNTSDEATATYVLDRAAPTITASPPATGNDATPTWTFSAAGAARTECRIVRATEVAPAWSTCESPATYDLTESEDGLYTFSVRAIDSMGDPSEAVSDTYQFDTAGPAAPAIGTKPAPETNDPTPTFAFTSEPGATFSCRLWRGSTPLGDWATCPTPYTPDLSAQPDGAFTFRVKAIDTALNPGAEAEATFTLDRAAPSPGAFTGGSGARGNDPDPAWSFSTPGGTTAECRLDLGDEEIDDWDTCLSPVTYPLGTERDGTYTVSLRVRDAAGNPSDAVTRTYVLDRVKPAPPIISGDLAPAGAGTTREWSFSGEADAAFQCRVDRGGEQVAGWTTCSAPHAMSLAGWADGTYTFSVRAIDAAQNVGDPATATYSLDRTAPTVSGSPPAVGSDETPTWTFSAAGAATLQCRLTLAGHAPPAFAICLSPKTFDLTERPDGVYTFDVRALDAGGAPSETVSRTYELDTTGPAPPALTEAPPGIGRADSVRWGWTGIAAMFECRLERDGMPTETWSTCTSPRHVALGGDGSYRLGIRGVDAVGNRTAMTSGPYVLDRAPPTPPAYLAAPAPTGNTTAPSWSFASDPGVAYECQLERDGQVVEAYVPCASPRGYDLAGRPDGSYVLYARAVDGAGNASVSPSAPYELDRSAPGVVKLTGRPGPIGNDRTPTWRFGATGAAAFECSLFRGKEPLAALGTCSRSWTFDLTGKADGAYTFGVRGLDAVGNGTSLAADRYVLDTEAPAAPQIRGAEAAAGADENPTWRFSGEAGAILECQLRRGDDVISRLGGCATPKSYDLSEGADGAYTFTVRATDAAGNTGRGATATYRLDRPEPAVAPAPAAAGTGGPAPPPATVAPESAPSSGDPMAPPAAAKRPAERRAAERRATRRQAAADAAAARRRASPDAPAGAPAPATTPERKKTSLAGAAQKLAEVGKVVAKAVGVAAEKSAFPGLLLAFCGVFLVVQDRIDRRDPKLALAPIDSDPELIFLPLDDLAADETEGAPPCPA